MEQKIEKLQRFKRILKNPKQKNLEDYLRLNIQKLGGTFRRPCSSSRPLKEVKKAATQKNNLLQSSITIVNTPLTNTNLQFDRTMKH